MELNTIQTNTEWGSAAGDVNDNFQKTKIAVERLENQVTDGSIKWYETSDELNSTRPDPKDGEQAWAGSPYPGTVWSANGGVWNDTGVIPDTAQLPDDIMRTGGTTKTGQQLDDEKASIKSLYNVSQINNNYAYSDKQTARNAVPSLYRGLGQIISYCLSSGVWVTERYDNIAGGSWANNNSWIDVNDNSLRQSNGLIYSYSSRRDVEIDAMSVIQEIYVSMVDTSIDVSGGISISALAIRPRTAPNVGYYFAFQMLPSTATDGNSIFLNFTKVYTELPANIEEFYYADAKCKLYLRVDLSKLGVRDLVYNWQYRICKVINIIPSTAQFWDRMTYNPVSFATPNQIDEVSRSALKRIPSGLDYNFSSRRSMEIDAMSIIQELYLSVLSTNINISTGVSISALAIRQSSVDGMYVFTFQLVPSDATNYDNTILNFTKRYAQIPTNVEEFYISDPKCKVYLRVDFSKLGVRDVVYNVIYRICKVVNIIPSASQLWTRMVVANNNQWYGTKIVWLGTSVPYGQYTFKGESYVSYVAKKLGFSVVPACVPGQAIHAINDNGILKPLNSGSTCLSKAEYLAAGVTIASAPLTPWMPGSENTTAHPGTGYNNYYRTWENIFNSANADADLYVFDIVPNNYASAMGTSDWDLFDYAKWEYTDGSSFADHRTTFIGAVLFLMDKMYSINPNARMVFMLGSSFEYVKGKAALQKISEKWNIPIIDIWGKVNTTPKSIEVINSTGSYPGSNPHPSDFGHEVLGNILANELLLIS